jgi:sporulation protein YlmC with PRC-barrel domain
MDDRSMLRLSEQLHRDVRWSDGTAAGTLIDLTIRHERRPVVRRLVVRPTRSTRRLIDWALVDRFEPVVVLRTAGGAGSGPAPGAGAASTIAGIVEGDAADPLPLDDGELCLARDVLDTQIIDTTGRRVGRVGDVLLALDDAGGLEVVAADIGVGAVVRRLGLRRASQRFAEDAVAWADLHLTSSRGHAVQLATSDALVHRLDPADLAHLLARLSTSSAHEVLRGASTDRAAGALHAAPTEVGGRLLTTLPEEEAARLLDALPEARAATYKQLLTDTALPRRRFRRLRGWRRHHGSPAPGDR